jgi:hypothetical protein
VNVSAAEVPPPGVGFVTVTEAVPGVAMSAAEIAARRLMLETKVVVRGEPFHWTADVDEKFEPLSVNAKAGEPATNELGAIDVTAGTGLLIVKVRGLEVPPSGAGLDTVIEAVPAVAMSAAVIEAWRLVPDVTVVWRALPFHSTVEEETKLEPATVRLKAGPPAVPLLGVREATDGAVFGGVEEPPPEPPPQPAMQARQNRVARAAPALMFLVERVKKFDRSKRTSIVRAAGAALGAERVIPTPQNGPGRWGYGCLKWRSRLQRKVSRSCEIHV